MNVLPRAAFCRSAICLLVCGWFAACSGGLRSGEPQIVAYVLRAPPPDLRVPPGTEPLARPASLRKSLDASVMVLAPVVAPGLASDGIALITADSRLDHYAGSRWADELPRVVSALAVHTLRGSPALGTVSDSAAPFASDYVLRIDITNFEARYAGTRADAGEAPNVRVRLECAIARRNDHVVVASFIAEANEAATENRLGAVIATFDRAAQSALTQLRRQTLEVLATQAVTP